MVIRLAKWCNLPTLFLGLFSQHWFLTNAEKQIFTRVPDFSWRVQSTGKEGEEFWAKFLHVAEMIQGQYVSAWFGFSASRDQPLSHLFNSQWTVPRRALWWPLPLQERRRTPGESAPASPPIPAAHAQSALVGRVHSWRLQTPKLSRTKQKGVAFGNLSRLSLQNLWSHGDANTLCTNKELRLLRPQFQLVNSGVGDQSSEHVPYPGESKKPELVDSIPGLLGLTLCIATLPSPWVSTSFSAWSGMSLSARPMLLKMPSVLKFWLWELLSVVLMGSGWQPVVSDGTARLESSLSSLGATQPRPWGKDSPVLDWTSAVSEVIWVRTGAASIADEEQELLLVSGWAELLGLSTGKARLSSAAAVVSLGSAAMTLAECPRTGLVTAGTPVERLLVPTWITPGKKSPLWSLGFICGATTPAPVTITAVVFSLGGLKSIVCRCSVRLRVVAPIEGETEDTDPEGENAAPGSGDQDGDISGELVLARFLSLAARSCFAFISYEYLPFFDPKKTNKKSFLECWSWFLFWKVGKRRAIPGNC